MSTRLSRLKSPSEESLQRITRLMNELQRNQGPLKGQGQATDDLNMLSEVGHALDTLVEVIPKLLRQTEAARVAGDTISPVLNKLLADVRIASDTIFGDRLVKPGPRRSQSTSLAHVLSEPILDAWRSTGLSNISIHTSSGPFVTVLCLALNALDGGEHAPEKISSALKRHPPPR